MDEVDDRTPLVNEDTQVTSSQFAIKDYVRCSVGSILVLLGIAGVVIICAFQTNIEVQYGVVLDAGSSHTELFVYQWATGRVIDGTALVEQIGHCKGSESISSYANDPGNAGNSLTHCIETTAKKNITSYLWDKSPIYLGATAGMRLLSPDVANQILSSVRQTLRKSGFMFKDDYAKIITGKQEGVSAWITVNYLLGHLMYTKVKPASGSNASLITTGEPVKGALDMGGASTQIAFTPQNLTGIPSTNIEHIKLYGTKYKVYTHSYLCYGKKEAERRFLVQLVKDYGTNRSSVDNPCGPRNYVQNVSASFLRQRPCGNLDTNVPVYTFRGTGNAPLCAQKVSELFRGFRNLSFPQPAVAGSKFLAFSGYSLVIKDLNLNSNVSLDQLRAASQKLCNKTVKEVKQPNKFWPMYCFDAQYIYAILTGGYHFTPKDRSITFRDSIHGRSLGWSLGFMINATNMLPAAKPRERVNSGVFLTVIIFGGIFIAVGIMLLYFSIKKYYHVRKMRPAGLVL